MSDALRRPAGADFFWPVEPRLLRFSRSALANSRPESCGFAARAVCASLIPDLEIPALPRVDNALRRANEAALHVLVWIALRWVRLREREDFDEREEICALHSSFLPPQPQPQPPSLLTFSGDATGAACLLIFTSAAVRERLTPVTADLPLLDRALRRASEASRAPPDAEVEDGTVAARIGAAVADGADAAA